MIGFKDHPNHRLLERTGLVGARQLILLQSTWKISGLVERKETVLLGRTNPLMTSQAPGLGGEEPGFDDHPNVVGRIKRRKSDSELFDIDNDYQENQLVTELGNESFAAADISAAVHEAQEKISRLRALLGHDQDELIQDLVGNNNNHQPRNQMMFPPQDHHHADRPMRRSSEHGMPWSPTFHHEAVHHQQQHQQQQACMQQVTMVKLQAAMERTNSTMKLLQDWDRAHGLPASHCQTMVNSSRSRKQLKEGVVLKKWNGSPLLNFMRMVMG